MQGIPEIHGNNWATVDASNLMSDERPSSEEGKERFTRLVPEELFNKSLYNPMSMMEMIYHLTEALCDKLAECKPKGMKGMNRKIRELNRWFMTSLMQTEEAEVVEAFRAVYEAWYERKVLPHIMSWVYAYQRLVMNNTDYSGDTANWISIMMVTRQVCRYSYEYDCMINEQIRGRLAGSGIGWGYAAKPYVKQMEPLIDDMLRYMGVDGDMRDRDTDNGLSVFKNTVMSIEYGVADNGKKLITIEK